MKDVYIDTNIFIYANEKLSPYQSKCNKLLEYLIKSKTNLLTSAETIQEIIYYSQKRDKLNHGIKVSNRVLSIVSALIPTEREIIDSYLQLLKKYLYLKTVESRDFLHLASCIQYEVEILISYDKELKKFKEVRAVNADEFLRSFT